jgi:hypothetical protein
MVVNENKTLSQIYQISFPARQMRQDRGEEFILQFRSTEVAGDQSQLPSHRRVAVRNGPVCVKSETTGIEGESVVQHRASLFAEMAGDHRCRDCNHGQRGQRRRQ